jgi:hypothetical protein
MEMICIFAKLEERSARNVGSSSMLPVLSIVFGERRARTAANDGTALMARPLDLEVRFATYVLIPLR